MEARILVVDDEKFIVEAISQHLKQTGYDVVAYTEPAKAKEAIEKVDFDLVLTDLRMPNISGMDITRAVQERENDTLVIILTGYATLDSAIESVHLQVYAYLNKPFDLRQLGQVVERALSEQQLKRENQILQARIAKNLNDVTTLHKVSQLLYDTDDWGMTLEFVLDTLALGIGLTHSCILFHDKKKGYILGKANFPGGSPLAKKVENYSWKDLETKVSLKQPSIINANGEFSELIQELSSHSEPLHTISFIPIRYRERVLGFLVIYCVAEMECITEDQHTLLDILATQIAPQVFQSNQYQSGDRGEGSSLYPEIQPVLQQYIDVASSENNTVGISLLRFITPRALTNQAEVIEFHRANGELIHKHEPAAKIQWLLTDTALMIIPGANQVQADITCMVLADDFSKSEIYSTQSNGAARLITASAAWPQDGSDIADLITTIWSRFMPLTHHDALQQIATKSVDA